MASLPQKHSENASKACPCDTGSSSASDDVCDGVHIRTAVAAADDFHDDIFHNPIPNPSLGSDDIRPYSAIRPGHIIDELPRLNFDYTRRQRPTTDVHQHESHHPRSSR